MREFLDTHDNFSYIKHTEKSKQSWLEIPEGAEVLTGSKSNKFSWVFWRPSTGEVFQDNRFDSYSFHNSISFDEYIERWVTNPILWKMGFDNELVGKHCLIVNAISFQKDIHIITDVHPTNGLMVYLDNDFDSLYHCKRALYVSDDVNVLQEILDLQEKYLKAKDALQYQLKCLESEYMKNLKELRK